MKQAFVLYGATAMGMAEFSADLRWATGGYSVPDPIFYCEVEGKKILLASSLEIERARKEAKVDEVISLETYIEKSKKENLPISALFLKERGVTNVTITASMRYSLAKNLATHFELTVREDPFFSERAVKTEWEVSEIEKAQRAVEAAVGEAMEFLREGKVRDGLVFHRRFGDTPLSSFHIRKIIDDALFERGHLGVESIVACGIEAADPHAKGMGLIRPNQPIVIDIFPRSLETLYFADQTRTVFKGEPSDAVSSMYEAVLKAQELAVGMIKAREDGAKIEEAVREFFDSKGYPTDFSSTPVRGFIHSLGHGVGLEIHEEPNLSRRSNILRAGNIVTVEPGLYYQKPEGKIPACGIRIEDMVLVTEGGCRNLTNFPKKLDEMIV